MKKLLLLVTAIALHVNNTFAQNLVTNPGFENYSACPTTDGQIDLATGWSDPTGTGPDYYNTCANMSSGYSVPSNNSGTMTPHGGNAYAGFFTYFSLSFYTNTREYIQVQLISPLAADSLYNVSFYVARAGASDYAASTIGAYFSDSPVHPPQTVTGAINTQVTNPNFNIISDTTAWTLISGSFTATGGEQYLTIGNFKTSASSSPTYEGGSASTGSAYYYIDDISVTKDMTTAVSSDANFTAGVSIYPNPASEQLHVDISKDIKNTNKLSIALYDFTGKPVLIRSLIPGDDDIISTATISSGIYMCKMFTDDTMILSKKISILK